MKVAFLTTVNHNVGDEFIREGIVYFLKKIIGDFEPILIHKHEPLKPVPNLMNFKGGRRLWKIIRDIHTERYFDQILDADIIIQAGAPVYWYNGDNDSSIAEWVQPFWYKRVAKIYQEKPVLNIAAGACLAYNDGPEKILNYPKVCSFISDIHNFCTVTTVRDHLAGQVLEGLKLKYTLLPCSSIFAKDSIGVSAQKPEFFVINYMDLGGHYTFGQSYKKEDWAKKLLEVCALARKQFPVKWICHNKKEVIDAKEIGISDEEIFYADTYIDYIKMYSKGACGLLNRVHGAMMLASYGRKSFVIGTDSRVRMAELIGIPTAFVGDAIKLPANEIFKTIMSGQDEFSQNMDKIIHQTRSQYESIIKEGLKSIYVQKNSYRQV